MAPRRQRRKSRLPVAFALVAIALFVFVPGASAARDPIADGTTDLHMKNGFLRKLGNLGVTVQPVGAASVSGRKIALDVVGGKLDPAYVRGFLETRGGFKLAFGRRAVPVTQLTVNTVRGAVFANVAKARMQVGTFTQPTSAREGFGTNLKAVKVALTEKAVRRISNRLGLKGSRRLNPGRVLSNLYSTAEPETVAVLPQGAATFVVNSNALDKLEAKGVKVPEGLTAIAPATKPKGTTLQFPIGGGTLAPDASKGNVEMTGGMQILKETESLSPTMRLRNLLVDVGAKTLSAELEILPSPPFPGAAGRSSIVDVVLPPNSVVADPAARTITVRGAEARLQAGAASTLNDVFNQPAPAPPPSSNFVIGDPLGTLSVTVQAR